MARTNSGIYQDYRMGRRRPKKRGISVSMTLFILDLSMGIAMLILSAATIICVITPKIPPQSMGILSTIVLAAPIIYLLQIIVLFYWVLRWKWNRFAYTLIFVIVATCVFGRYYQTDYKQKPPVKVKKCIKAISYNISNANNQVLIDSIKEHNPTIICLQEYLSDANDKWDSLGEKYTSTASKATDFSCEIITNHIILKQGLIDSLPRYSAMWADLKINNDTVRVINLHLQSTTITTSDIEFVQEHQYMTDSARTTKIQSITKRLVENNILRSKQADKVRAFIDNSPVKKMIVCGDFNDVPLSYSFNTIAKPLVNTFKEAGSGYVYTFDGFFRLLTIDHMLVSEHFDILSYEVDHTMTFSDHYPIITRLRIKNNE